MTDLAGLLEDATRRPLVRLVVWGQVIAVAPLRVRIAGDTSDVVVERRLSGVSVETGQRVVLLAVGSAWVLAGVVV